MKVSYCDYGGVSVLMSKEEFEFITKIKIGDQYGNCGLAHGKIIGQEVSLTQLRNDIGAMERYRSTSDIALEKLKYCSDLIKTIGGFPS